MVKGSKADDAEVISFRLFNEKIREIEDLAKGKSDETGRPMSVSKAARDILLAALKDKNFITGWKKLT